MPTRCQQPPRLTVITNIAEGTGQHLRHTDRNELATPPLSPASARLSGEDVNPISPSYHGSDCGSSDGSGYDTPMTSPCTSPVKSRSKYHRCQAFDDGILQLDGGRGSGEEAGEGLREQHCGTSAARARVESAVRAVLLSDDDNEHSEDDSVSIAERDVSSRRSQHDSINLTTPDVNEHPQTRTSDDMADITPLVPASPAKGADGFPFPRQPDLQVQEANRSPLRYPSVLLNQCESRATPRQRRLMTAGIQLPDRFMPSRAATPTKEALLLAKPLMKLSKSRSRRSIDTDPFGPLPTRSIRMLEQSIVSRVPAPPPRSVGASGSRVRDAQTTAQRAASAGTIWIVGGSIVTEGVASTTNGRGGRVTSGTNAPHYTAGFLNKNSPSEEMIRHGRRLAMAIDISQSPSMLDLSSSSPVSPCRIQHTTGRVWRNDAWERDDTLTPTKLRPKKTKDVPIIPFRVLDAPALRDDYYCSLLSYSPTVNCLAVGLGPHVYLWSESRGPRTIPDSMTAPYGTAHVTSVSFSSEEGNNAILAIGRADGRITLWSPLDRDPRFDSEQPAPVSCVSFRPSTVRRQSLREPSATVVTEELLVGDEVGFVYYYSVEWPNQDQRDLFDWHGSMALLARIGCHTQQVCGVTWSPSGEFFATGGNDNQLFLFESKKALQPTSQTGDSTASPVHVRSGSSASSNATVTGQGEVLNIVAGQERRVFALNAAVKAMAFAPWQHSLLAAGGGSNDRCIHFFHTLSGASLATIDCHAQVTSLVWSSRRKEIAATFGFAQPEHPYRVAVFAWPSCNMVVGIPWYSEERALYSVTYPRGPSGGQLASRGGGKADSEGRPWYGKRTREEGCLVVATSDASIKFHEIWAERSCHGKETGSGSVLAGSQILEGECSTAVENSRVIR